MIAPEHAPTMRRGAKLWLHRVRLAWVRRWDSFTPADLLSALRRAGVRQGDVVMVHSSFDRFESFSGKPGDVISALQQAVGPAGTILMPTFPFDGLAVDYVARGEMLDVARTPSRMGLLTELFRRLPEVIRSAHPTHPVAAWGARANEMVARHHLARTPCGRGSPFARLLDCDGKILLLGVGIEAMSFFHAVEEFIEPMMPFTPFTKEFFSLRCRDRDGTILVTHTRLWDPHYARQRNIRKVTSALRASRAWKEVRLGNLNLSLLHARQVFEALRRLADQGVYCYGP